MWGTARIIRLNENPEEFNRGFDVMRLDEISMSSFNKPFPEEAKPQLNIIKIVPDRIAYFDSTGGAPVKYLWENNS